ncbi:hypothetical protein [Streptomyces sp. NPDC048155]|uniref:hypothetical protein n=1 Tax=Streptomyces sp. NPDC048155 TaxID=3154818 RepID=UPI0033D479C1
MYAKLRAEWVKSVSNGNPCQLVSPWIVPGALIPVRKRGPKDINMWWTVFEPSPGWSQDEKFSDHQSASNPALAAFNGGLVCAHRGGKDDELWYTVYNPESGWSADTKFGGGMRSGDGPALAVYDGKLHLVHRAKHGNDYNMWHATYTTATGWGSDNKFRENNSLEGPALAVYGGELYCIHRGWGGNDQSLWWTKLRTGQAWTGSQRLPNHLSSAGPAAVVFRDKNGIGADQLLVVHRGHGGLPAGAATADEEERIAAEYAAATADIP